MKNIVKVNHNDLVVSIQDVADFAGIKYASVKRNITRNPKEFELLGLSLPKEYDWVSLQLNEPQASFLMTLLDNTEKVVLFKLELVMQFYAMRDRLCETNRHQLELVRNDLKLAQSSNMKTYKDGFTSLRKYLKDNEITLSEDRAWDMLLENEIVENRPFEVMRKILTEENFGRQEHDGVIEFNSRALDDVFSDYVYRPAVLPFMD